MNLAIHSRPVFLAVALLSATSGCATVRESGNAATFVSAAEDSSGIVAGSDAKHSFASSSRAFTVQAASHMLDSEENVLDPPIEIEDTGAVDALPAMTLADIEQSALSNNPAIASAMAASSKASGLLNQVGVRPNPTAGYFGSQIADEGTDQHGVFVEQEFVRGNKLQLNQQVLRHTAGAQRWEAEAQRQRVLTDVRVRFYEAIAAQHQLQAIDEFVVVANRGVSIAADRLTAGEGSKVDLLQAKTLVSETNLARQQTFASYLGAWKDLAAIAGLPERQPVLLVGTLAEARAVRNWESTYAELLAQSPELMLANELVCEKRANLRRQKVQATPNVTAQLGAGYDNATDSGMINLQFAAPIPVFNRNSGNIAAAYADYTQSLENVKRIELAIRSRLARVAQEYETSIASVQMYEQEILPQIEESLSLSEEAYTAGELDFLQVLVIRQRYFDSRMTFIRSQGQFAQANAKIEGLLLSGGLDSPQDHTSGDDLRGQSFGGQ